MNSATEPSRSRSDWGLILLLFAAGLLAAQQFAKVALVLPAVAVRFDGDIVGLAWLVSVVGVTGIVLGVVAGQICAALSPRVVLLTGLWSGAALSAVQLLDLPLWLFGVSRVAEGISHLAVVVAAPTLIAGAASDTGRPVAMGLWATFFGVAFALSAVAYPWVEAWSGLRGIFAVHAAGLASVAALAQVRAPRAPRKPLRIAPLALHVSLYSTPRRAMPALCFVFYTGMFVALITLVPPVLERPELAASLPLLSLSGTFLAGWLSRRIHPAHIVEAGFAMTLVATGVAATGSLAALYLLFIVMGLVPGACFALIPHLNPTLDDRALATGGIAQMGNVGTTFGTPILAAALALGDVVGLWAGVAVLSLCGWATCRGLLRAVRQTDGA